MTVFIDLSRIESQIAESILSEVKFETIKTFGATFGIVFFVVTPEKSFIHSDQTENMEVKKINDYLLGKKEDYLFTRALILETGDDKEIESFFNYLENIFFSRFAKYAKKTFGMGKKASSSIVSKLREDGLSIDTMSDFFEKEKRNMEKKSKKRF